MSNPAVTANLLFQLFVIKQNSPAFPPQPQEIDSNTTDIVSRIGRTGDKKHKLGFVAALISFNQSDAEVRNLIGESFEIAQKKIAVGFHIDDQMFWENVRI